MAEVKLIKTHDSSSQERLAILVLIATTSSEEFDSSAVESAVTSLVPSPRAVVAIISSYSPVGTMLTRDSTTISRIKIRITLGQAS